MANALDSAEPDEDLHNMSSVEHVADYEDIDKAEMNLANSDDTPRPGTPSWTQTGLDSVESLEFQILRTALPYHADLFARSLSLFQ